jgi:hypothetical protein
VSVPISVCHHFLSSRGPDAASDMINKSAGDETPIGEGELVDGLAAELRQMSTAPMDTAIAASELAPFLGELAGRASTVVVGQTRPPCSTG